MTTNNSTIIRDNYDLLDALESETYSSAAYAFVPESGEQTVKLMRAEAGSKYPFKCDVYPPTRNDSKRVWNERKGQYDNALWDQDQAPDAIIRPKAIKLYFQNDKGGYFTAYLANYVDRLGIPAWNKFVDTIADQTQGETLGMNITQVLNYLVDHPFKVYPYNNPKYKEKQVCYTEHDYLYWKAQEDERTRKEKAAVARAEKACRLKAAREIEQSVELSKERA